MPTNTKKIRIIPATAQAVTGGMQTQAVRKQVAAYARVSTDTDEQLNSYEAQKKYFTDYITARPEWDFVGIYADEGITGTSTKRRVRFNDMIRDALDGKIDYIVTKSISRFARNTLDCLNYMRQLKQRGIGIYFVKENIDTLDSKSEVVLTILSSLAQDESRNISENVRFGLKARMLEEKVTMPYGSFLGYKKGADGAPEIVPEEAETVRLIYKLFLDGKTPTAIARRLEADGIKSPRGKDAWHTTTIRSILQNEKYMGDAMLQKSFIEDFLTKKHVINTGQLPKYYVENSHPAIISKDVFNMVQAEMKRREQGSRASGSGYTFAGRLFCADCGGLYGSKVWHSNDKYRKTKWRCNEKYKEKGAPPCASPNLDEQTIQQAFIDMFNDIFDDKDTVIAAMESVVEAITETTKAEDKLEALDAEARVLEEKIQELIRENATTSLGEAEYMARYQDLGGRYEDNRAKYAELKDAVMCAKARRDRINHYIQAIKQQPETITDFDESLWNALIDHGTVSPDKIVFTLRDGTQHERKFGINKKMRGEKAC